MIDEKLIQKVITENNPAESFAIIVSIGAVSEMINKAFKKEIKNGKIDEKTA